MITFTPSTSNELQLTDDQLQIVVGGRGCHERRDDDCDDQGDNDGWRGSEWGDRRRRRGCFHGHSEHEWSRDEDDVRFRVL